MSTHPAIDPQSPRRRPAAAASAATFEPDAIGLRLHREQAKTFYARAVLLQVRLGTDTTSGGPWLAETRRLVHRLVDLVHEDDTTLLGLVTIKSLETPEGRRVRTHAVNVAILSLVLSRQAGLPRQAMAEVAMAALLHDVGLDATEDSALHGLHGAECLLQLGPIESVVRPALVALEHHVEGDLAECGTSTRIVQIADLYDTLTARGGAAATPDRVLSFLLRQRGASCDPTLVKALAHALGVYPPGTLVRLEGGETGVVLRANRHPDLLDRPLVRVLRDASGKRCETVRTIDLAARDENGHFVAAIATSLAPAAHEESPAAIFLGAR